MTPQELLADFFPASAISWKPQSVKGNRAMAVAYIDARDVMDRLDAAVGVGGWQDDYHQVPDGSVVCRLTLQLDGRPVTKVDVGSPSEQPDGGDRLKAAFSDALKRAAVKFGVGRYLYSLPHVWCDYDATKRQFVTEPKLPAWAVPKAVAPPAASPTPPASPAAAEPPPSVELIDGLLADLAAARGASHAETLAGFLASYGGDVPTLRDLPRSSWPVAVRRIRKATAEAQPQPQPAPKGAK